MITVKARGANVNRIRQHLQNDGGVCFITAFRNVNDIATNNALNKELEQDLRGLGLGIIKLIGGYPETQPSGEIKKVVEKSFVVVDNNTKRATNEEAKVKFATEFKQNMQYLCSKYNQNSVLIRYYVGNGEYKTGFLDPNGNLSEMSNEITFQGLQDYWSKIHNKTFRVMEVGEAQEKAEKQEREKGLYASLDFDFSEANNCIFDFDTGNAWRVRHSIQTRIKQAGYYQNTTEK